MTSLPKSKLPPPAYELCNRIRAFDDDQLVAMGAEFQRQRPSDETTNTMLRLVREHDGDVWYPVLSRWVKSFVEDRFTDWDPDGPHRYIRIAVEAAAVAAVIYAAGELPADVYRDACRGFHEAYGTGDDMTQHDERSIEQAKA